jgi:Tol biopolymer transport system component
MGEVYRARDSRLDREVAVKVLPRHLSSNPELRQRFEREARTASSLNHPHICTIHDVGHHEGTDYLVMEFIEGETLAATVERGPLAVSEALRYAIQLADALDKAHRRGLIHRDLKPGNVMITKEGAKLMDFGLAKATGGPAAGSPMTAAATMSSPLTAEGTIVGTFQYMAPEQLEGGEATSRSDIFSFGTVLYEMLSGARPFIGRTQASLAASILKESPRPLTAIQPMTPPALERLVATCMEKDPDERRQTMHDVLLELRWIAEGGSQAGVPAPMAARRRSRERTAWLVAAAMAAAAIAIAVFMLTRSQAGAPAGPLSGAVHVVIGPPPGMSFDLRKGAVAISRDGSRVAFVTRNEEGERHMWVRRLDRPEALRLEGTEGAASPFWSPDGRSIAFFAGGRLKRIGEGGGAPDTICPADGLFPSGTWAPDGTIIFSPGSGGAILGVSSGGGRPEEITSFSRAEGEFSHRNPVMLPDGRHFLYNIRSGAREGNSLAVASLDGGEKRILMELDSNVALDPQGWILFWRDEALRAQRFDPGRLELIGDALPVAPGVRYEPDRGYAQFSISANGILAYHSGEGTTARSRLVLYDRDGSERGFVGPPGNFYAPRFSHDGRRVAVDNSGIENNGDVWIYEVGRPGAQRLSSDGADQSDPSWSPDDRKLAYFDAGHGAGSVDIVDLSRQSEPAILDGDGATLSPDDWHPDGKRILIEITRRGTADQKDLGLLDVESGQVTPWLDTGFEESTGVFSPDGRWVAYQSNDSGRLEVYLQPFPGPGARAQISAAGGAAPRWRGDGREIFYVSPDGRIMAAEVETAAGPEVRVARELFRTEIRFAGEDHFDVSADGRTFVVNSTVDNTTADPMALVLNWTAILEGGRER